MTTYQQKLVEQYVPLANKLAFQKKQTLPAFIDVEDLQSAAYLGLAEAASRFNPDLGIAFSTFAYRRVFGAIQDFLRNESMGKRGDYQKVYSLNHREDDESCLQDMLETQPERNDEEFLEEGSCGLGDQAKEIIRLYFIDELSMREVGEKFDVSESRISQMIKSYKERISAKWSKSGLCEQLAA